MIDLRPFTSTMDDIEPGETQRFDHHDCTAGADTRQRLYITRQMADPSRVVAYCHNCQQYGTGGSAKYEAYRDTRHGAYHPKVTVSDEVDLPSNLVYEADNWTVHATAWAIENKLTQADLDRYNIGLDPTTGRVILPRYDTIVLEDNNVWGDFMGYQARKVDTSTGPKYYTARKKEDEGFTKLFTKKYGVDLAVIVEDLVSGIHIARALQDEKALVIVNYGTKINLQALNSMMGGRRYVWLDNDSNHVIEQAKTMGRTLDLLFNGKTLVRKDLTDPKHYPESAIRSALDCG